MHRLALALALSSLPLLAGCPSGPGTPDTPEAIDVPSTVDGGGSDGGLPRLRFCVCTTCNKRGLGALGRRKTFRSTKLIKEISWQSIKNQIYYLLS